MKIAILGTGRMGSAMAERLLDLGHHLTVWNRTAGKSQKLLTRGAQWADTPAQAVADSEVILSVLTDAQAIEQAYAGPSGVLSVAVAGKLAGVHVAARVLGWPRGQATQIGWLLQTKALITIVFANVLLEKGIISSASFTALLLMAIGSTMLTMPMIHMRRK